MNSQAPNRTTHEFMVDGDLMIDRQTFVSPNVTGAKSTTKRRFQAYAPVILYTRDELREEDRWVPRARLETNGTWTDIFVTYTEDGTRG